MKLKENETVIIKKMCNFFTQNVNIKKVLLLTPWTPGITGQVLASQLFKTQYLGGKIYLTNQRVMFETGKLDKGLGNLEFDIPLKDISQVTTGRKGLVKTFILWVAETRLEFTVWGINKFIEAIMNQKQGMRGE